jgi:hypothetical protein
MLIELPDELIAHIIRRLGILPLLKFICSTKKILHNKSKYMESNETVTSYFNHYNEPYLKSLANSHIKMMVGKYLSLFNLDYDNYDRIKIYNTTKIISFECNENNRLKSQSSLSYYYSRQICTKYQYDLPTSKWCVKQFQLIFLFEWPILPIHLYDIYEILFHMYHRKYGRVKKVLYNMTFIHAQFINETISFFLQYYDMFNYSTLSLHVKCAIIYILYSYVAFINTDHEKLPTLSKIMISKSDEFAYDIKNLKYMPSYLKQFIINKIKYVAHRLI